MSDLLLFSTASKVGFVRLGLGVDAERAQEGERSAEVFETTSKRDETKRNKLIHQLCHFIRPLEQVIMATSKRYSVAAATVSLFASLMMGVNMAFSVGAKLTFSLGCKCVIMLQLTSTCRREFEKRRETRSP